MEKKEIKNRLAELVEDGAVTLREALDLEDNEVEFLSKCHSNNFSFYNDELADVTFDTSSGPLADVVTAVAAWAQHQQEESR